MSFHRNCSRVWAGVIAAVLSCSVLGPAASPCLADEAPASKLQQLLDAGEFGPARRLADQAANTALRNRWLSQIATAQAAAGARSGSLSTLAEITDDRRRTQVIDDLGGHGGAALADFDTLIELITSTIAPTTWDEVGGPGAIEPFPTGVFVDSAGMLKRISMDDGGRRLARIREQAAIGIHHGDVRKPAALRKVSLTRLEKQIQLLWAQGRPIDQAMRYLAGIYQVKYLLLYPESGDIVLAGPAGDWTTNAEGRTLHAASGRPTLQLDDLVVLLRQAREGKGPFGCAIRPRKENLAATQAFLKESSKRALKPHQRAAWLGQLRDQLGQQDIHVFGLDPQTRVARILVEADYRMKLVGMGLEDGVLGVQSYLDSLKPGKDGALPAMSVLRWWFALNYEAIRTTDSRDAFQLHGQGVKVLSENELLTERGERIHTGTSDELNREFARSFTRHFDLLAAKYPIYAELRNIFDLALIAALLQAEDAAGQVGWHMPHLGDPQRYIVQRGMAPTSVETVINHRLINRRQIVAGVSGGVHVDPQALVERQAIKKDEYGLLQAEHSGATPKDLPDHAWWWD